MENSDIKSTMAEMMASFGKQMADFETRLQQKDPSPTVANLAADFASFKTFMLASLRALQEQVANLAHSQDLLEMHSRRKMLLIHGVPEEKKEDSAAVIANVAVGKLKVTGFCVKDISRCHRMGRQSTSRPRPLLVKLRDVSIRDKLWFSKANLKDTGITLSEFLTKYRHDLFMKAREQFGIAKCWTRDGKIFVGGPDFTRHRISCAADLERLLSAQLKSPMAQAASTSAAPATARSKRLKR